MRRNIYLLAAFLLSSLFACYHIDFHPDEAKGKKRTPKQERIQGAIDFYKFTASDVDLGYIPQEKLLSAIEEGQRRAKTAANSRELNSIANPIWRERGPNNRGGRTRAIMIDSTNHNRIWVGGVSGGLWRSEDITQNDPKWVKLGIHFASLSISDIAQDPTDFNTIYVSTGESYTGDVRGAGIFKSTDDGNTWTRLPSTINSIFQSINELWIHSNGDVYAATENGGLFRSVDGGGVFEKVAGTGIGGVTSNNFHDIDYNFTNNTFYTSNDNDILKSTTGNLNSWISIGRGKPGFPGNVNRIEMTMCPSDPNIIYCIGAVGSFSSNTYVTNDGGENWVSRTEPAIFGGYGQAWYDLEITADPSNCYRLISGGVVLSESTFQGLTWRSIAENVHADHHNITFDPNNLGRTFFGNDGGIWLSENFGTTTEDKSDGYVTTQFYACAIHPAAGSPYIMGGTQDNNSLIIEEGGLSPSRTAWGGDGVFCFIDQNEPNIQIVSSQNGNYGLSLDGGNNFGFGASIQEGDFINRSGYDNNANILYGQAGPLGVDDVDYFRWFVTGPKATQVDYVDIGGYNINVTAAMVDPAVPNRLYLGGQSGLVLRIDNAHEGLTKSATIFADLPGTASVSSIYMDKQTSSDALISLFNYGAALENLYVTYNGGAEWTAIEGDLPDMPIRWAIFDPANHDRAMIATDAGVWTTDDIDGSNTHWVPSSPDNGMPFVRVDMLVMRDSDKVVLAGTYGRGLMTTDIFAAPAPVILTQPIAYEGQSIVIDGSLSVNAQSYAWDFGDSNSSTEPKVNHTYQNPGTYTISLTINGSLTLTRKISILPYLPAPYEEGGANYAGDFETSPEHFAGYSPSGSTFTRGVSDKPGKDGTHSGSNAWVLGINDNLYQNNTRAELYTPMYNLTEPGLYEFKFWGKYAVQNKNDGFQVEYSLDGGATWQQLGTKDDIGWYNYHNQNLSDGAFPIGKSYFTNAQLNWTQYIKDVSFLVGESRVSFRFVFRSDESDVAQGLAIDDVQLTKYDGELKTTVTVFTANYTADQEVTLNWTTGLEYQAQRFYIERSFTGFGFTQVGQVNAKGVVSTFPHQYETTDQTLRNVIYYRLRVVNENPDIGYFYEFYTDTIIVRRNVQPDIVQNVLTNPFKDEIYVSFSSIIQQDITARLFDVSGKLVREEIVTPNSIAYVMRDLSLIQGVYVLSIQVGDGEPKAYKLFTLGY